MIIAKAFGDKAVIIPVDDNRLIAPLSYWLVNLLPAKSYRVHNGLDTILVEANNPSLNIEVDVRHALSSFICPVGIIPYAPPGNEIEIKSIYDGEDISNLAKTLSLTPSELIKAHQDTKWRVALVGFAPGFPYLVPLNDTEGIFSNIARLDTPRRAVPKGSIALAAGMSAVYPSTMPGGWNLIGHTDILLFDASLDNPSTLNVNDIVRFVEAK